MEDLRQLKLELHLSDHGFREQRSELLVQEEEELRRGCNGPVNQHECFSLASHRSEEDSSERRSPSRLAILGAELT